MDRYLSGVLRVLNSNVGGISKRISESAEIAEAIQSTAPDLFKRCDGLPYWLHANDQFLVSLYSLAAEGIDRDHRRRVHEMKKTGREEVFGAPRTSCEQEPSAGAVPVRLTTIPQTSKEVVRYTTRICLRGCQHRV